MAGENWAGVHPLLGGAGALTGGRLARNRSLNPTDCDDGARRRELITWPSASISAITTHPHNRHAPDRSHNTKPRVLFFLFGDQALLLLRGAEKTPDLERERRLVPRSSLKRPSLSRRAV